MSLVDVFLIRESRCPSCGDPGAYIGLSAVECPNKRCRHFDPKMVKAKKKSTGYLKGMVGPMPFFAAVRLVKLGEDLPRMYANNPGFVAGHPGAGTPLDWTDVYNSWNLLNETLEQTGGLQFEDLPTIMEEIRVALYSITTAFTEAAMDQFVAAADRLGEYL